MLLGARQFFEKRGAPTPPLPYDAEVEWIGSTGFQWIDTGVLHSSPCAYMLDCRATPSSNEQDFFGSYVQPTGACVLGFYGNFIFGFNPPNSRIDTPVFPQAETDFYLTYSFAASTRTLTVNGQSYQGNGASFNGEKVMLFCGRTNGGIPVSMKCRAFRIERDGVAVFDGISVRFTNEHGVSEGAMYDRVSGKLFRNAGTGAFTIGPDVYRVPSTVGQYVQNGIVQQWDGIENAGIGLRYVAATQWNDIITGKFFNIATAYEDGVSFTRSNTAHVNSSTEASYTADHDLTLHTVVTAPNVITYEVQAMIALGKDYFNKNGFVLGGIAGYSNLLAYWSSAYSGGTRYLVDTGKGVNAQFSLDFVFDYANLQFKVYVDGAQVGTTQTIDSSVWNLDGVTTLRLGMGANSGKLNDATGFRQHGIILYNRKLTAAEIAANYAIDKARFNLP